MSGPKSDTTTILPSFIGVDLGKHGGDRTAEVMWERLPDGTLCMIECWTYGATIEESAENAR